MFRSQRHCQRRKQGPSAPGLKWLTNLADKNLELAELTTPRRAQTKRDRNAPHCDLQ